MIEVRPAFERGHANHGWLDTYHSFSFAHYYDPKHMGVSALRVINDDTVAPGMGFGTHGHRDMEIVSYVLTGALEHRDSMGFGSVIRPGEVQRMSAGTGVTHSEYNASDSESVNFLQIWIVPNKQGVKPDYAQRDFAAELEGQLRLVISPDGETGSIPIHQDAKLYVGRFDAGHSIDQAIDRDRSVYIHVAKGRIHLNDIDLGAGDGVTIRQESHITIQILERAEILYFDLP